MHHRRRSYSRLALLVQLRPWSCVVAEVKNLHDLIVAIVRDMLRAEKVTHATGKREQLDSRLAERFLVNDRPLAVDVDGRERLRCCRNAFFEGVTE